MNTSHVQEFYSLRNWSVEEVAHKFGPYISHPKGIEGYCVFFNKKPFGYIQIYPASNFPWEGQKFPSPVMENAAGLDLFVGEEGFIGKGLSYDMLQFFLKKHVWTHYEYCIVDPDERNKRSICFFTKSGFVKQQAIQTKDPLGNFVTLHLFIARAKNVQKNLLTRF